MPTNYIPNGFFQVPAIAFDEQLKKVITLLGDGSVRFVHDTAGVPIESLVWDALGNITIRNLNGATSLKDMASGGSGTLVSPWVGWEPALNSLPAGASVIINPGVFSQASKVTMKDGWQLLGSGRSSLINAPVPLDDAFFADGVDDLVLDNFQLNCTGQTGADSHGVRVINGSNPIFSKLYVHGAAGDGIRLGPSGNATGAVVNPRILFCELSSNGSMGLGATDFSELTAIGNTFNLNTFNGVDLEPTASPVTGNLNRRIIFALNQMHGNAGSGINCHNDSTVDDTKAFLVVIGNVAVANTGGYGIQIGGFTKASVVGNVIAVSLAGVRMELGAKYLTVQGNTITNCLSGVSMDGATTSWLTMSGNTIVSAQYVLKVENGATVYSCFANQCDDCNNLTNVALSTGQFWDNVGFLQHNKGFATVANGSTSIVVNHGLFAAPTVVVVSPTNNLGNATKFWVDPASYTATQFTITVDGDPGAGTATFAWRASIE